MIPPSLARLIEKWRTGLPEHTAGEREIYTAYRRECADELSAALQSMTAEEPVAYALKCDNTDGYAFLELAEEVNESELREEYGDRVTPLYAHPAIKQDPAAWICYHGEQPRLVWDADLEQPRTNDGLDIPLYSHPPLVAAMEIEGDAVNTYESAESVLRRVCIWIEKWAAHEPEVMSESARGWMFAARELRKVVNGEIK